jgi:hypothetical protein
MAQRYGGGDGLHLRERLKWVYKVKRDPADNVMKYKARPVGKGYTQRMCIDFDEVFVLVARLETL